MSDQKNNRLGWLEKLGLTGRVEAVQAELEGVEQALTDNGVEHKDALSAAELPGIITALGDLANNLSETYRAERLKASFTVDDVADLVIAMMKEVEDVPADERRDKITMLLAEALGDDTAEIEMSLLPLVDKDSGEDGEAGESPAGLLGLIEQMADTQEELAEGQAAFTDAAKALADVPDLVQGLSERLEKVERQLRQRPRASLSPETELDGDSPLAKGLKKQVAKTTKVAGIEVYEAYRPRPDRPGRRSRGLTAPI